jgi:hypothetical protein
MNEIRVSGGAEEADSTEVRFGVVASNAAKARTGSKRTVSIACPAIDRTGVAHEEGCRGGNSETEIDTEAF